MEDEGLYFGDAIRLFLNAKAAGGRSARTVDEYRKKLDLFQRWAAARIRGEGEVDVELELVGTDEVEAYAVHMKERGLSDSSRKNHLAVLRSFFDTLHRRLGLETPPRRSTTPDSTRRPRRGATSPSARRGCCSQRSRRAPRRP